MSRTALHYADQRNDALGFIADLAHAPSRDGAVWSNPGTKAEVYAYRHRLYRWRRTVLAALSRPGSKEAAECLGYLRPIMGARFTKDWLDYTRFDIVEALGGDPAGWRVRASIGRVMYGPDLVFADDPDTLARTDDLRELLDLAQRQGR